MKNKTKRKTSVWCGIFTVLLLFGMACQKDNNNDPAVPSGGDENPVTPLGDEIVKTVKEQVLIIDSLSSFATYLEDFQLSEQDASEGITIFAPVDEAFTDKLADEEGLRKKLPDSSNVEDYIVKGIIRLSDLTDGEKLTALSGNRLTVSIKNEVVTINGVSLTEQILNSSNVTVFSIAGLLKKNPSVMILVMDGAAWSPDETEGLPASSAHVYLYNSREDFAGGRQPAYTAQTNADGKAYFREIDAGTYYIVAEEQGKSNVLADVGYRSLSYQEEIYRGYIFNSVFADQEEIANSAVQPNARPGNFKLVDWNADGIVDQNDFARLPYDSVVLFQGVQITNIVLIGYSDNMGMRPLTQSADLREELTAIYKTSADLFLTMTMVDGYLSDDVSSTVYPWALLDNFTFTQELSLFREIWDKAYFQIILRLNRIMRDLQDIPGLSGPEKEDLLAQAQFLRANCYLQIVPYFGYLPLVNNSLTITSDIAGDVPSQAFYDQIVGDLESASERLPAHREAQESHRPTKTAAEGLLAEAYFRQNDYSNAASYARAVINNPDYRLLPEESDAFKTSSNSENIWDISGLSNIIEPFRAYFGRGSYCPAVHLTEMYLIEAESLLNQSGPVSEAIASINVLRTRKGMSALSAGISTEEAIEKLHSIWQQVMSREGERFLSLNRWDTTMDILGMKGFQPHRAVLPAPAWYIERLPNLLQSPGY